MIASYLLQGITSYKSYKITHATMWQKCHHGSTSFVTSITLETSIFDIETLTHLFPDQDGDEIKKITPGPAAYL